MDPSIKPMVFSSLFMDIRNDNPPEIKTTISGGKVNVVENRECSPAELMVIPTLCSIIQDRLGWTSLLLPFIPMEVETQLSKYKSLIEDDIDIVIGEIWILTQELVLKELIDKGETAALEDEKEWLLKASAKTFESVCNIFNYRYPKTTSSNKDSKEPLFYIVFTNRQAQALLACKNKIMKMVNENKDF